MKKNRKNNLLKEKFEQEDYLAQFNCSDKEAEEFFSNFKQDVNSSLNEKFESSEYLEQFQASDKDWHTFQQFYLNKTKLFYLDASAIFLLAGLYWLLNNPSTNNFDSKITLTQNYSKTEIHQNNQRTSLHSQAKKLLSNEISHETSSKIKSITTNTASIQNKNQNNISQSHFNTGKNSNKNSNALYFNQKQKTYIHLSGKNLSSPIEDHINNNNIPAYTSSNSTSTEKTNTHIAAKNNSANTNNPNNSTQNQSEYITPISDFSKPYTYFEWNDNYILPILMPDVSLSQITDADIMENKQIFTPKQIKKSNYLIQLKTSPLYHFGFSKNSGRSFSPFIELSYIQLFSHFSVETGVNYFNQGNIHSQLITKLNTQYDFGLIKDTTILEYKTFHYLSVPIKFHYITKYGNFAAGLNVHYLLYTQSQWVEKHYQNKQYSENITKSNNYITGLNTFNYSLILQYQYYINRKWFIYAMYYQNISNWQNNKFNFSTPMNKSKGITAGIGLNLN